jgi:polyisoprenoid-binding protein YceI
MAANGGRHRLGPDNGRLVVRTYRTGLAAQAGHDLILEFTRWSGELDRGDDPSAGHLEVRIDMGSLTVREGTGGVKPLTDRDRREIAVTARKTLGTDRNPEATFAADKFQPDSTGGGAIDGTLTLNGQSRPFRLQVSKAGDDTYRATGSVTQSGFGIKPYSGMFGALKLRDQVDVEAEVTVPATAGAETPGSEAPGSETPGSQP